MNSRKHFSRNPQFGSCSLSSGYPNRFSRNLYPAVFFEGDDGANPTGGDNAAAVADPPKPQQQTQQPSALEKAVTDVLSRNNNDSLATIRVLVGQNHRLEQRAVDAEGKVGKVPDEMQTELEAYRAIGKPDEITQWIEEGKAATSERDGMKREKTVREACELAGIDYSDFTSRKGVDDWVFETKPEKGEDGKTDIQVPYVTVKDEDGKEITHKLAEHAFKAFPTLAKADGKEPEGRHINPALGGGGEKIEPGAGSTQKNMYRPGRRF